MPSNIDALSANKKSQAQAFIHRLLSLEHMVGIYDQQIEEFKHRIDLCASLSEYENLMQDIDKKQQEIEHVLLQDELKSMDLDIQTAIDEYIKTQTVFKDIIDIKGHLAINLIAAHERICIQDIFSSLDQGKKDMLLEFIKHMHEMQPYVNQLDEKKQKFQKRLAQVNSEEQLIKIEKEIETEAAHVNDYFNTALYFPEDEESAGALIRFLGDNQHLMNILQHFDFYDMLREDIVNARNS